MLLREVPSSKELTDAPVDHELDTTTLSADEAASSRLPLLEGPIPPAALHTDR